MLKSIMVSTALAALLAASPARATLQLAVDISGDSFTCADNAACDTNPAINSIVTGNVLLDGILFSSASAASTSGAVNSLNASNLLILNTNLTPVTITLTVSNTDFTPALVTVTPVASGVWQGASATSSIDMKWFIDPTNTQGANNPFDTPGVQVATTTDNSAGPVLAFATNIPNFPDTIPTAFSMTEQATIDLGAGEALVNRGQSLVGVQVAIPETSTWLMVGIGFGVMGLAASRRRIRPARTLEA
jgi:hypothetical protein